MVNPPCGQTCVLMFVNRVVLLGLTSTFPYITAVNKLYQHSSTTNSVSHFSLRKDVCRALTRFTVNENCSACIPPPPNYQNVARQTWSIGALLCATCPFKTLVICWKSDGHNPNWLLYFNKRSTQCSHGFKFAISDLPSTFVLFR